MKLCSSINISDLSNFQHESELTIKIICELSCLQFISEIAPRLHFSFQSHHYVNKLLHDFLRARLPKICRSCLCTVARVASELTGAVTNALGGQVSIA